MRVVFCTCPAESAREIAHSLVNEGLVACVNVIPGLSSVYRWKGELCEDAETLLLIKTRASLLPQLTERLVDMHPYEVPEVIALPLAEGEGNPDYLKWLLEQTA